MHTGTIVWVATSAALVLAITVTTIRANLSVMAMVDEMNLNLPPEKRIGILGWGPVKTALVFSTYPSICPNGKARARAARRIGLSFLCVIAFAICFLGFGRAA